MNIDAGSLRTEAEQTLIDGFQRAMTLPMAGWAATRREAAMDAFRDAGLPHRRMEQWKYTDLRAALKQAHPLVAPGDAQGGAPENRLAGAGFATLTFVDGVLSGAMPDIPGVTFVPLNEALQSDDAVVRSVLSKDPARGGNPVFDLNTATANFGGVLLIAPHAAIETPINVRWVVTGRDIGTYVSRLALVVGEGASATVFESFEGDAPVHRNAAVQATIGDGATLRHLRLETESDEAVHLSNIVVEMGAEANYCKFGLATGAALMRNDLSIRFNGEHASADVDSVFLKSGRQHHDTTMFVDHAVPNCTSRELFKSVLGGAARGVFQGKIIVRPDAQKTDGAMSANAILLSDTVEMDAKPELEIYADDVVCGHGATSGQLDEDLLFFLRARGIAESEAKALLILAFIGEALEDVDDETVREHLLEITRAWIAEAEI